MDDARQPRSAPGGPLADVLHRLVPSRSRLETTAGDGGQRRPVPLDEDARPLGGPPRPHRSGTGAGGQTPEPGDGLFLLAGRRGCRKLFPAGARSAVLRVFLGRFTQLGQLPRSLLLSRKRARLVACLWTGQVGPAGSPRLRRGDGRNRTAYLRTPPCPAPSRTV